MKKLVIIGALAALTLTSCEQMKKCCQGKKSKTEKAEGACGKCGSKSCNSSCNSNSNNEAKK